MNNYSSTLNSPGLLKSVYPKKKKGSGGIISQMNDQMPMMQALRAKRDALRTK